MYIMGQRIFRLPLICVYMKMPHDIKKRGVLPVTDKKQLKTELLWLAAAVIGVFGAAATSVITANVILKRLPAVLSVPLSFVSEWLLLAVPVLIMIFRGESFSEFLPSNEKLDRQLFSGFVTGMILTSLLTLAPMMLGFGDSIKSVSVSKSWQYIYYLLFSFLAQAAVEELLFRGYFYSRINRLFGETAAMISSSVLFGLFNFFGGNLVKVILMTAVGIAFCILRRKDKDCTLLSLALAHGIYLFMNIVWSAVFMGG